MRLTYMEQVMHTTHSSIESTVFSGNIFFYIAYDVGDDISLASLEQSPEITIAQPKLSKYFKGYHVPLSIELSHQPKPQNFLSAKLHNFGVISLAYKIPFSDTLGNVRKMLVDLDLQYRDQSARDAHEIFKHIKSTIKQARFYHLRSAYIVIQTYQSPRISVNQLEKDYGSLITSFLRLETEWLAEYQKNEMLDSAIGYYRGDLIIIDTDCAFIYDDEYEELLDLFEFANIQRLELEYYNFVLDAQLDKVYQRETRGLPFKAYLPFIGTWMKDPVSDLGMLQVEISSIVERLESTIKASGEAYVTETYDLLAEKMDLNDWKESIHKKLTIIRDIHQSYQNKIDIIREDLVSTLIILLIFTELVIGILSYVKK